MEEPLLWHMSLLQVCCAANEPDDQRRVACEGSFSLLPCHSYLRLGHFGRQGDNLVIHELGRENSF